MYILSDVIVNIIHMYVMAIFYPSAWVDQRKKWGYVIVKPHHEEDIFVITRGRGGAKAEM